LTRITSWALAFSVTVGVELVVAIPLLGPGSRLRRATAVALAQLVTHPIVWFVLPQLGLSRTTYLVLAETWAIVGELLLYRLVFVQLPGSQLLAAAALANGCSLAAGTLLW
jgi:hypothetical protein